MIPWQQWWPQDLITDYYSEKCEGGREIFFLVMWLEIPVPYNWPKVTVSYAKISKLDSQTSSDYEIHVLLKNCACG